MAQSSPKIIDVKLDKYNRERILTDLVKRGNFSEKINSLMPRFADLAIAVYNDRYTEALRHAFKVLPNGTFPKDNYLKVKFGEKQTNYTYLYFSGYFAGHTESDFNKKKALWENVALFVTYQDHKNPMIFSKEHKFAKTYFGLEKEIAGIKKDQEKLIEEINGILLSVSTVGKLLERWPEIEPVVKGLSLTPKYLTQLPAIVMTDLNKRLGLKKAA